MQLLSRSSHGRISFHCNWHEEEFPTSPEGFLEPNEYRTVREAIGGLNPVPAGVADPNDPMHKSAAHKKTTLRC